MNGTIRITVTNTVATWNTMRLECWCTWGSHTELTFLFSTCFKVSFYSNFVVWNDPNKTYVILFWNLSSMIVNAILIYESFSMWNVRLVDYVCLNISYRQQKYLSTYNIKIFYYSFILFIIYFLLYYWYVILLI